MSVYFVTVLRVDVQMLVGEGGLSSVRKGQGMLHAGHSREFHQQW